MPKPRKKDYCHVCEDHFNDYLDVQFYILSISLVKNIKRKSIKINIISIYKI